MRPCNPCDDKESWFVCRSRANLHPVRIIPHELRFIEVDSVLLPVLIALFRIEFEFHGIWIIPEIYWIVNDFLAMLDSRVRGTH